jgi:serine/threonine protein kinase
MSTLHVPHVISPSATYTTEELLASTEFFSVYRASSSVYYSPVILRYVRKSEYLDIAPVKANFQLISQLHHPAVSPVIEWFELPDAVCCVTEFFPGRTLRQYLDSSAPLSEDQVKALFGKILDVVEFFHEHGYAHRNLSDSSLIVGDNSELRFVGLSFLTTSALPELVVKDPYTAFDPPEALLKKPTVGVFADCWALGVLLYALVTQKVPWVGTTAGELYYVMTCGNVLKPPGMNTFCHTLVLKFLEQTPTRRFSVSMAKQQGWVTGRSGGHQRGARMSNQAFPISGKAIGMQGNRGSLW